ncbi:IS701-like element ISRso17 family transposase, partial [Ralstonia pseudosolanacearum]
LPKEWADDATRRQKAGVPDDIVFATKPEIALAQVREAIAAGVPAGVVLADAAYGDETGFRENLTELGLLYAVGIRSTTTVWPPGVSPLPAKPASGPGRPPKLLRRAPGHEPVSVKTLAMALPSSAYQVVTWREGINTALSSRFAAVRVRPAHRDYWRSTLRDEEWLLVEWPGGEAEPTKYFLSTAPADALIEQLVFVTKMRWRIERDYQDLKQELGLGHYEGRGWRGFHHHATLSIAAYGFLMAERLAADKPVGNKKNFLECQIPALPADYIPRGSPACAATRDEFNPHTPSST